MPTNFQQSKDVLHPIAFNFVDKCKTLNVILNAEEINAIDFLVRQLIQNNLWEKFKAIYPFVGRSASSHSLNLKNIQRHYIVWYNINDLVHDSFGITNKNKGYGNTMIAPSWFNDNDIHVSVYHSTYWQNTNDTAPIIGSSATNDETRGWMHSITLRSLPPTLETNGSWDRPPIFTYSCGYSSNTNVRFAGKDASEFQHVETYGFIVGVNGIKCYVNGNPYGRQGLLTDNPLQPINEITQRTVNNTTAQIPNLSQFPFLIFTDGRFTSTAGEARCNIRFASFGYELNDNENKILYQIIQQFQKILKRNVEPVTLKTFEQLFQDQYLTFDLKINKILIYPTKPYREYLSKISQPGALSKINALSASVNISKVEVFGPVRIFCADALNTSVSIQSLSEL